VILRPFGGQSLDWQPSEKGRICAGEFWNRGREVAMGDYCGC
jgi:hypothetical protein